jgi:hypothetical protein
MNPRYLVSAALMSAALSGPAMAEDITWSFVGMCENALCKPGGPDATTPASVTATITFSDLTWEALADGGFQASVSDAFDFGYAGPAANLPVGSAPVNSDLSYAYSSTPSVDGIYKFDILWGEGIGGAPALGYLSGGASGWNFGTYLLLGIPPFIPLPIRLDSNSSPIPGQWNVSAVPEPGSLGLLGVGFAGTLAWVSRRRKASLATA